MKDTAVIRHLSIGAKIFWAIVAVAVLSVTAVGLLVYGKGREIVRHKTLEELSLAARVHAHYLEYHLEDLLQELETLAPSAPSPMTAEARTPGMETEGAFPQSFLHRARSLRKRFPWVQGLALRDGAGHLVTAVPNGSVLSSRFPPYTPLPLTHHGVLVHFPVPKGAPEAAQPLEVGIWMEGADSTRWFVTASVSLKKILRMVPIPEHLGRSLFVALAGAPGARPVILSREVSVPADVRTLLDKVFQDSEGRTPTTVPFGGRPSRAFLWARARLVRLNWPLMVALPATSTHVPLSDLFQVVVVGIAVGTGLAFLVALYASSAIVKPIKRLTQAFREFSKGDWQVQVPATSSDEIGELTDGFNEGVRFLASQHARLRRFRALVRHSPDAVLLFSASGGITYCNEAAFDLLGYQRREDLALKTLADFVCPRERSRFEKIVWPGILEGRWEGELSLCRRDSRPVVTWVRAGTIPSDGDGPQLLYAVLRDISERKRYEKALQEAEEYYRSLFRSSQDAILVTDPHDIIVDVNEAAFEAIFGYTKQEVVDRSITDLYDSAAAAFGPAGEVWGGSPGRLTLRWKRKDGTVFLGETTVDVLENSRGQRRGYLRVVRDVSERVAFMEKLEKAYNDLKGLDQLKDRFLAGVSHDLRSPLIPVRAFLQRLLERRWGPLNDKQEEFLRYCLIGVDRELILVEELLDYTRLQSGRLELRAEELDLQDVIRTSLFLLQVQAEASRLRVQVDLPQDPVMIRGDYNKLLRIFNNLFSNAVKYNRPEGRVSVRGQWVGGGRFRVEIEDTGVGIPRESLDHIFEHFYRVGGERAGEVTGAGLGLAVVRELVRLHEGSLDVHSTVGVGSVFAVTFPTTERGDQAPKRENG
ncbi:PAS domain S-box-containing protein [Desulfacinum hydrothermale DSM 13146]|uniref:histidine kinase n=1 Tax=Desulfacinum hydrothermale DSM 13146 TaxID=1121390 RepID=A0A1W1XHI0_9BACT|nr:PAS domain S-box protein [Desulfacinum hydrothermale]SMC23419.1 PAS domain S-box-containing protein [Desulfacinum hydrothermale DSM 13146]